MLISWRSVNSKPREKTSNSSSFFYCKSVGTMSPCIHHERPSVQPVNYFEKTEKYFSILYFTLSLNLSFGSAMPLKDVYDVCNRLLFLEYAWITDLFGYVTREVCNVDIFGCIQIIINSCTWIRRSGPCIKYYLLVKIWILHSVLVFDDLSCLTTGRSLSFDFGSVNETLEILIWAGHSFS